MAGASDNMRGKEQRRAFRFRPIWTTNFWLIVYMIDASSDGFLATGAPTVGGGLRAKQIVMRTWIEGMLR